jgi:simple sugar transport system substrate-binding protein
MDKIGGQLITIDKVNPSDSPNITVPQIVDDMIEQGAQLIVATSDDMKDGIFEAAANNPEIPMVFVSGDNAWKDGEGYRSDLPMLANMMGKMEYGKMIAGCAAALQSDSGKISFLGPLINSETRRLASSAYLGANYCWNQNSISSDLDLEFKVTWIGFWFNIPGFTLDPTVVVNEFIASGSDVIISGIDTTEAIVVAGQATAGGKSIWALPYDYEGACDEAPDVCLGVPYFNWGPSYTTFSQSVIDGSFNVKFDWMEPDWNDINNHDSSAVGFLKGDGLTSSNAQLLDTFISSLADGSLNLWKGPLNYQDGSAFLTKDQIATDKEIWYLPMLLEGMEGASTTE